MCHLWKYDFLLVFCGDIRSRLDFVELQAIKKS